MNPYRTRAHAELAETRRHLVRIGCHPESPAMLAIDAEMRRRINARRAEEDETPLRVTVIDYGAKRDA